MKLLSFDQYFKDSLKDPEFKKLWEKSEPKYQLSRQIIKKRLEKKMSQQELAKKSGTTQAVISKGTRPNKLPNYLWADGVIPLTVKGVSVDV